RERDYLAESVLEKGRSRDLYIIKLATFLGLTTTIIPSLIERKVMIDYGQPLALACLGAFSLVAEKAIRMSADASDFLQEEGPSWHTHRPLETEYHHIKVTDSESATRLGVEKGDHITAFHIPKILNEDEESPEPTDELAVLYAGLTQLTLQEGKRYSVKMGQRK
ncbi:MAG: hypothetical protein ACMG6E_01100, partial [Candidatus Roizmanbacteria bacterium]